MKKYKEFVRDKNLSESFIGDAFRGIRSFLMKDKQTISGYLDSIVSIEKDYIDKTDELNYDIFLADHKKSQDPVVSTSLKQKAVMARRAISAIDISKNSEIKSLMSKIGRICKKNPDLLDYYKGERAIADSDVAKYAYEKAKRFKDKQYEDEFYDIWKESDANPISYKKREPYVRQEREYDDIDDEDLYDTSIYKNLGSFGLSVSEFNDLINTLPKKDLETLLREGINLKSDLDVDYNTKKSRISWKRASYGSSEYLESKLSKEKLNRLKKEHSYAIDTILNNISILKRKLKIED